MKIVQWVVYTGEMNEERRSNRPVNPGVNTCLETLESRVMKKKRKKSKPNRQHSINVKELNLTR